MNDISLTTWLAVYGAILSSILLGWNLYRDLTDKGKLKVYCYIGKFITEKGIVDNRPHLVIRLTNTGRRPINVTTVGGKTKKKQFVLPLRGLPKMLSAGEETLKFWANLSVLDENLTSIWALDSLGNKYKVKKKVINDLKNKRKDKLDTIAPDRLTTES